MFYQGMLEGLNEPVKRDEVFDSLRIQDSQTTLTAKGTFKILHKNS